MTLLTAIVLSLLFYINEPVAVMREEVTHDSRVASQALFSEKVSVEKQVGDWSLITTPDGYQGWAQTAALVGRENVYDTDLKVSRLAAHLYGIKDTEFGPIKTLPFGSQLKALDASDARWIKVILPDEKECFIQRGDVAILPTLTSKADLAEFANKFKGLPYTWGGRTSFGYDCSGFVQMLYNQIGVQLQRDAKQQILDERFQDVSLDMLTPGDLVFFGQNPGKIQHVGLYIGDSQFIHSTVKEFQPWIRVSSLKDPAWAGGDGAAYPYRVFRKFIGN